MGGSAGTPPPPEGVRAGGYPPRGVSPLFPGAQPGIWTPPPAIVGPRPPFTLAFRTPCLTLGMLWPPNTSSPPPLPAEEAQRTQAEAEAIRQAAAEEARRRAAEAEAETRAACVCTVRSAFLLQAPRELRKGTNE